MNRTWLAILLSCVIWFGYLKWFAPPPPAAPVTATPAPTASGNVPAAASSTVKHETLPTRETKRLSTDHLSVGFSSLGGRISSASLIKYTQSIEKNSPPIEGISENSSHTFATLFSDDELKDFSTAEYKYTEGPNTITFTRAGKGIEIRKEFTLNGEGNFIQSRIAITKVDKSAKNDLGYLLIPLGAQSVVSDAKDALKSWEVVYYQNDSVHRTAVEKLEAGEKVSQGNTAWAAFGNRYFTTSAVNESALNPDVVLEKSQGFTGVLLRYPIRFSEKSSTLEIPLKLYVGPKDYAQLSTVKGLQSLIDYGFFSIFAFPLLRLLQFFYAFVHNYGVAIILLTLLVRLLFYPLAAKSARSMKAMQRLQPQIQALKEKHKDDMQRINQEQMALFKAHGVNPLGGCMPMLLQLPVFFALYSVLANSIELFHAPFFLWIHDLSSKDPYYVFPVLMGISMFAQQKLTPMSSMDPMQQKMMLYIMPVVFTFIMINLPSGLTIYIFLSTLLSVVQQWIINREPHPEVSAQAPQKT